jgi:hypothetical protein
MLARIDEVQRLVSAEASGREEMLRLLKEQHAMADMQAHGLQAVNDQLSAVKQSLSAIAEMKDTLSQIAQVAAGLQVTASASTFLRFIDPTRELPVILVDFLGRELTIPADWIETLQWRVSSRSHTRLGFRGDS